MQIKNILKDRILHGVYPIQTNIPSEPQLETEFTVSKITIRNAIKELCQEGYLEKGSGKGTKVIRNTATSKLSTWKRFTELLVEEGHQIQKQLLSIEVISTIEATEPRRLFGEQCIRIERLYELNGLPYIHYTHYLTMRIGDIEQSDLNAQSLYGLLEENDIALEKYRDQFAVAYAPPLIEERLQVKENTPLLKRLRYSYDEVSDVVEYSEGYYNTTMQNYVVNYNV
ncbi:GntR family transcriptional regulator [Cohnella abietis]|uniref:GntR family transcriptional regulator n=1 Tax=Cohnella abietis TaxID=2507935 RepID=A0A3T1DEK9_9BACL|nr:GntR family transcriptional regulator [Cohnella abietis]